MHVYICQRSVVLRCGSRMAYIYLLGGDIGGTNSRFQLFRVKCDDVEILTPLNSGRIAPGELVLAKQYLNSGYKSFFDVCKTFLDETNVDQVPVTACLAVAGPVCDNAVHLTNRNWTIDGTLLQKELRIQKVTLVNDFVACGYGLLTLDEEGGKECVLLHNPSKGKVAGGPIACVGAGTGLGECYLTATAVASTATTTTSTSSATTTTASSAMSHEYHCYPSEGGHAEFSPRNDVEYGLLKYLKKKYAREGSHNRVSIERVVAGSGLPDVYEYLSIEFPERVDPHIHEAILSAGDLQAAMIARNKDKNELCRRTMDIFLTHYGSEAGVACLKWIPTGGLYLTGGNTPKNIDEISNPNGLFMQALHDKGRVKGVVVTCPVWAVLAEDLGERGAHFVAFKVLQDILKSQQQAKMEGKLMNSATTDSAGGGNTTSTTKARVCMGTALAIVGLTALYVIGKMQKTRAKTR